MIRQSSRPWFKAFEYINVGIELFEFDICKACSFFMLS